MKKKSSSGTWTVIAVIAVAGVFLLMLSSRDRQRTGKGAREGSAGSGDRGEATANAGAGTGASTGAGGLAGGAPGDAGNLLQNPGFEDGDTGWTWLSWSKGWAPFEITDARAHGGKRSAHLAVRSAGDPRATIVWGVVQEVKIGTDFPGCMEGWYMVSGWKRGAAKQYLQTALISQVKTPTGADQQIRMILTGLDVPSYSLSNARYYFADPKKPVTPPDGEWVRFDMPVAEWFGQAWTALPPAGTTLRAFFEGRFDDRVPSPEEAFADVYFDDLYLGPCR